MCALRGVKCVFPFCFCSLSYGFMPSSDLWLQYIRAEMSYRDGQPENVGKLHWRAMKTLKPDLTAVFITQYSQLN